MNKFTKKMMGILTVGTAAFMMAGCSVAKSSNSSGTHQDKDTVKIGVNMELSGTAAGYGNAQKQGIQLAAAEIGRASCRERVLMSVVAG